MVCVSLWPLTKPLSLRDHDTVSSVCLVSGAAKASRIDAWNEAASEWFTFWLLRDIDSDLPAGVSSNTLYPFQPTACPTLFSTRVIRIFFSAAAANGDLQLDAISLNGVAAVSELGIAWVTGSEVRYVPPSGGSGDAKQFFDTFTYASVACTSSFSAALNENKRSVTLKFVPPVDNSLGAYARPLGTLFLS
jgi:hypothetical protein